MSVCGVCGRRFALPQDLGAHVRGGDCDGGRSSRNMEVSVKVEIHELSCPEQGCDFQAETFNMLLFHQSLAHSASWQSENQGRNLTQS